MTDPTPADDFREFLLDLLPKAQHRKVDAIVRYFEEHDALEVYAVEVSGARVGIETVEAYGLEITVDANGNAESVSTPHGFLINDR